MKVQKSFYCLLIVALMLVAVVSGCSGQQAAEQPPAPAAPAQEEGQASPGGVARGSGDVILATTTSTADTGLLDALAPLFKERTAYTLKPVAVGTGQALQMGREGNADALLVHAPASEQELVDAGIGINYKLVMHNDFIVVGPASDPAGIKGLTDAAAAFTKIHEQAAIFVSRADDSGTHKKELEVWAKADLEPGGDWYVQTGEGMGQTLTIASERGGYTLTDRGTYLALKDNLHLDILVEGDEVLKNIYHVMQVNPEKFPDLDINAEGGKAFVDFMVSPEVQEFIGSFGVQEYGQPLFFPDAGKGQI